MWFFKVLLAIPVGFALAAINLLKRTLKIKSPSK